MFRDRLDAGRQLAAALRHLKGKRPIVLALPRGGVPIGAEVAQALEAPLDLILVRKIGAPGCPELAAGAVVDGGEPVSVFNEDVVRSLGISDAYLAEQTKQELKEIERRRQIYLGDRSRPEVEGQRVIVVDDGIATGATVRAALQATRQSNPAYLVLGVPVASPDIIESLRPLADEIARVATPEFLGAVGAYYVDFRQVSDSDVKAALDHSAVPAKL